MNNLSIHLDLTGVSESEKEQYRRFWRKLKIKAHLERTTTNRAVLSAANLLNRPQLQPIALHDNGESVLPALNFVRLKIINLKWLTSDR